MRFQLLDIKEALTKSDLRTTLKNLPRDLNETYLRIIRKTSQGPRGQAKLDTMRKAFRWIAAARRPLRVDELEECIALEATDTYLHADRIPKDSGTRLVGDCSNLAVINDDDNTVSFAHHTVKQFLLSHNSSEEMADMIDLSSSEADLGNICLSYLSFSDFETQLAKAPTQVQLEAPLAREIVWSSVPLAGRVQKALLWAGYWRGRSDKQDLNTLSFAVPVSHTPTEILTRKYALLEYIIEHWVSHTSHLRPASASWPKFRHLALYRQLDFEFRPWNETGHQKHVKAVTERSRDIWKKAQRRRPSRPFSLEAQDSELAIYAWALGRGVGSLFGLLNREIMADYLYTVRSEQINIDDEPAWERGYVDFDTFFRLLQVQTSGDNTAESNNQRKYGWSGDSLVRSIRMALPPPTGHNSYRILLGELRRWIGGNAWSGLAVEIAVSSMHHGDAALFDCVWGDCTDDSKALPATIGYWKNGNTFKTIEDLLSSTGSDGPPTEIVWSAVFFMMHYLSEDRLIWIASLTPACKNSAPMSQALLVVAMASECPIHFILDLWPDAEQQRHQVQGFDPVDNWMLCEFGSPRTARKIMPFVKLNAFALIHELACAISHVDPRGTFSDRDLSKATDAIIHIWLKYNSCFSVHMVEKSGYNLLKWAVTRRMSETVGQLAQLYEAIVKKEEGRSLVQKVLEDAFDAPHDLQGILHDILHSGVSLSRNATEYRPQISRSNKPFTT